MAKPKKPAPSGKEARRTKPRANHSKKKATKRTPDREKKPKERRQWKEAFLMAFAATGNVLQSCIAAAIDRTTAYAAYHSDEDFRRQWKAAQEDAGDHLEFRADQNLEWEEPVMYEGRIVFVWVDAEGNYVEGPEEDEEGNEVEPPPNGAKRIALKLKKHDPALFSLLLKARNPARFRENVKHTHTGAGGGPIELESKAKVAHKVDINDLASELEKLALQAAGRRVSADGDREPLDS